MMKKNKKVHLNNLWGKDEGISERNDHGGKLLVSWENLATEEEDLNAFCHKVYIITPSLRNLRKRWGNMYLITMREKYYGELLNMCVKKM